MLYIGQVVDWEEGKITIKVYASYGAALRGGVKAIEEDNSVANLKSFTDYISNRINWDPRADDNYSNSQFLEAWYDDIRLAVDTSNSPDCTEVVRYGSQQPTSYIIYRSIEP